MWHRVTLYLSSVLVHPNAVIKKVTGLCQVSTVHFENHGGGRVHPSLIF